MVGENNFPHNFLFNTNDNMADNKKKLTHKVTLIQGGTEATFRLTDK